MASNRYPIGDAVVVTCKVNEKGEWLATYPGFVAIAMAESDALIKLAAEVEGASKRIAMLATEIVHGVTTKYKVGERLILTCDCDLGRVGQTASVLSIDERYMALRFDDGSTINTGADYRFITRLGGK
jgi:hypothetical protein